jgi:hypothetical protein
MLRILTHLSAETLSIWPERLSTNRGNTYVAPGNISKIASEGAVPSFDCKNTDYTLFEQPTDEDEVLLNQPPPPGVSGVTDSFAPCTIQGEYPAPPGEDYGGGRFPQVFADP